MKLFSRLIALAALGCSAIAATPAPADARSVDCRRVPPHMRLQMGCVRPMTHYRHNVPRRPLVVIGGRQPYATVARPVVQINAGSRGMDPAKRAQLRALLAESAQALFGEGPEGATYHGYQKVPGTSRNNPCKPGYQAIKQGKDPNTGKMFFRCYRPDSDDDSD